MPIEDRTAEIKQISNKLREYIREDLSSDDTQLAEIAVTVAEGVFLDLHSIARSLEKIAFYTAECSNTLSIIEKEGL